MTDEWIPTLSPIAEARQLIADCKNSRGELHEESLLRTFTDLVLQRNRYMERLGLLWPLRSEDVRSTPAPLPNESESPQKP